MANHSKTRIDKLTLKKLGPKDSIASNFQLYELTKSELASRLGIDNRLPGNTELRAAIHLARDVLQPIRDEFGAFSPNSVFRSQALERALKKKPLSWISTSQHTTGCACDVEISGTSTLALAEWARDHLGVFDQIICECYDPHQGPNSGWVHISLRHGRMAINRKLLLSYIRDPTSGRLVYVEGLRASIA